MEINKYKANIYTDFTILSFHRPTTHHPLKSTATLTPGPTLPKPHYPSKSTIPLAFRTAIVCVLILLCICTIPLAFRRGAGLPLPLPPILPFPQPLQKDNNPLPHTMFLPPLSKGGGLTARHKLLSCCVLIATHLPFYSLNFSAVKTEGLLSYPTINEIFRLLHS